MKRIIRDRHLTSEEVRKYDRVREQAKQERPDVVERIRKRIAESAEGEAEPVGSLKRATSCRDNVTSATNKLGVDIDVLRDYAVVFLPENVTSATTIDELYDAGDSLLLVKRLKSLNIACRTALDFGVRPKVKDRGGAEVWLGVVWLFAEHAGFPVAVKAISEWLRSRYLATSRIEPASNIGQPPAIHVELWVEQQDRTVTLNFDGSAGELLAVLATVAEFAKTIDGLPR